MTESAPLRPDPRFYDTGPPLSVVDAVSMVRATIAHADMGDTHVTHVAPLHRADEGAAVFAQTKKDLEAASGTGQPSFLITTEEAAALAADLFPTATIAIAASPKAAFAALGHALHDSLADRDGPQAVGISPEATMAATASVSASAVVMSGAHVGENVRIGPFAFIGPGVVIGDHTQIGSHVSLSHAHIGAHCRILAGARVGEAGFGYVPSEGQVVPVPQLGRVILSDHVDIGANCTIDRGALEDTTIGSGTKIDNLVQIAHNCRLGQGVLIAAQCGISGSSVIGDGVMIAGQAGIVDHVSVGSGSVITAKSGVMKSVPAGERWGGIPAKPAREWMKDVAAISRLTRKERK